VLRSANLSRVVPVRKLSVRLVEDEEDAEGGNGVFQNYPPMGSAEGIVIHPYALQRR